MDLSKAFIFKFIKKYPRVSFLLFLLVFILLLSLRVSLKEKVTIIFQTLVIGLFGALAWRYFWRKDESGE